MINFNFWHKWLLVVSVLCIVFGVCLFLPAFIDLEFSYINEAFWESGVVPVEAKPFYNCIFGLYAAMEISWALFIFFIVYYPYKRKEKWAWNSLIISISAWYVIDTYFSTTFGLYTNSMNNLLFYLLFLIPLIFSRKYFHEDGN